MAGWYGPGKQYLAKAGNAETAALLKAQVLDVSGTATYTYARTHPTMEATYFPAGTKEGSPTTLTNVLVNAAGEIDSDDFTVTALSGDPSEAVVVYIETAAADASRIPLLFIDGLSINPNGGNYTFQISTVLGRF